MLKRRKLDLETMADIENTNAENDTLKALIAYNVMMGNIEDPSEEEGEDE